MYGPGGPTGIPETLDVRSSLDYDSNVYHVLTLYCPGPDTQFETMAEEDVEEMEKEQVRSDADLLQKNHYHAMNHLLSSDARCAEMVCIPTTRFISERRTWS